MNNNYEAWDLFRRGYLDQERHQKLLEKAVRENLSDLITNGKITTGGNIVIPIKHLKQWKLQFDPNEENEAIAAIPEEMNPNNQQQGQKRRPSKGDNLGPVNQPGQGEKNEGGEGHQESYMEVIVNADHIAEVLFEDLELPRIKKKEPSDVYKEEFKMETIRKKGIMPNLDKKRTVFENIKRNASKGNPKFTDISDDDLRFKSEEIRRIPEDKVACIFVRDRSGSMDEKKKELTRIFSFWIIKFLEYKYKKVTENAYILFDTEAQEVDEQTFISQSEAGGTKISSGIQLTQNIINERLNPNRYNLYVFVFSDGDNPSSDDEKVIELIKELSNVCNLIGYTDIQAYYYSSIGRVQTGLSRLGTEIKKLNLQNVISTNIQNQKDVLSAIKQYFKKGED